MNVVTGDGVEVGTGAGAAGCGVVVRTPFLYLDFDSWILFFFSRVRLLPSQILFFEISFSHFGKLEKVERRHNTKEKKRRKL